jgi:membrane protein DedA with SNARE-associated domain
MHTLHYLVEQYGLIAVFFGCVAEGESAALLAGFFAHQSVFSLWKAFAAAACGAFLGDSILFMLGRLFENHPFVQRMRQKPGFARADALIRGYPHLFVFFNRYVYGLRTIGGIAAGLSGISMPMFLLLNACSSMVWAALFMSLGYFFGFGAEQIIGAALLKHERLLVGFGIAIAVAIVAALVAHRVAKRYREKR